MTKAQIEAFLHRELLARIACTANSKPYVVPVYYAFESGVIYCQSREGLKLQIMRANPEVCLLIDEIGRFSNWQSVVVFGKFVELKNPATIRKAAAAIDAKFIPLSTGEQVTHLPQGSRPPEIVEKQPKAVYFQVRISEMTGRYEKA